MSECILITKVMILFIWIRLKSTFHKPLNLTAYVVYCGGMILFISRWHQFGHLVEAFAGRLWVSMHTVLAGWPPD